LCHRRESGLDFEIEFRPPIDPQRFDVRWHMRCARPLVDPITAYGQGDNPRSLLGIFQVETGKGIEVK